MVSRGCRLVANALGRFGTPSARHYDLAARSIAARIGRKCPRWKHGPRPKIAMVERRKARVPDRKGTQGRLASAPARASCVTRRAHRMPLHPGACRRSAHPSSGWTRFQTSGANASRERDVLRTTLFDIVRTEQCSATPAGRFSAPAGGMSARHRDIATRILGERSQRRKAQ